MELEKCYRVLGVRSDAKLTDVKAAYRRLALEYHPDRNKTPGAEAKFTTIHEAYSIIMSSKGIVDGWRPPEAAEHVFDDGSRAELSFAILTGKEVVYHVSTEQFEAEVRRRFNPKSSSGTYCKIGARWFEVDDQTSSRKTLWGSAKRGALTEWYKGPDGTDKWKSVSWGDFWSYVRSYASTAGRSGQVT
ncbi:MAG: J domain-containing protein [Thaumarchaeota archaeon]|nr:J domain-containing protein [Nitrososphaerota archaeon]